MPKFRLYVLFALFLLAFVMAAATLGGFTALLLEGSTVLGVICGGVGGVTVMAISWTVNTLGGDSYEN